MTLKIQVSDGYQGTRHLAGVSSAGELVVKGFGENSSKFQSMSSINIAYNFFIPKSQQNFIITSILFSSPANTSIDVYEGASATATSIDKEILHIEIFSKDFYTVILPFGGFLAVTEGEFLNAKTDTSTVSMTIIGYYRPKI
jgi:hypothetical protein